MNRAAKAYEIMVAGRMNCCQTVLTAFCQELGLETELALKLAQGFGGGMGRTGRTCGAVTGAYMVLGLALKGSSASPRESMDKTYALVREFNRKFKSLHASVACKELLGYDLSIPEGLAEAREKKVFSTVCPEFVRDSVKIVENLIRINVKS